MPGKRSHASNGHVMTLKNSLIKSMARGHAVGAGLQRGGQRRDEMIQQWNVSSLGPFDAARELRDIEHGRPGIARDGFRSAAVEVRIDDDDARILFLHLSLDLGQVRRGGGNAWFGFKKEIDFEAKAVREVGPGIMIGDHMLATIWSEQLLPLLELGVNFSVEPAHVGRVARARLGIDLAESLADVVGYDFGIDRVNDEMGIARGVNVSFGTVERSRNFHQLSSIAGGNVAGRARLQFGVARVL